VKRVCGLTSASAERERFRSETTLRQKPTKTQNARPPASEAKRFGCRRLLDGFFVLYPD